MRIPALVVALCVSATLAAQSNETVSKILGQPQLQFEYAAYLVCSAAQLIPDTSSLEDAAGFVNRQNWGLASLKPGDALLMGDYASMLAHAYQVPGGLFYSIFPGSRYALREFVYRRFINAPAWPSESLSGEEAMRILIKLTSWLDDRDKVLHPEGSPDTTTAGAP